MSRGPVDDKIMAFMATLDKMILNQLAPVAAAMAELADKFDALAARLEGSVLGPSRREGATSPRLNKSVASLGKGGSLITVTLAGPPVYAVRIRLHGPAHWTLAIEGEGDGSGPSAGVTVGAPGAHTREAWDDFANGVEGTRLGELSIVSRHIALNVPCNGSSVVLRLPHAHVGDLLLVALKEAQQLGAAFAGEHETDEAD